MSVILRDWQIQIYNIPGINPKYFVLFTDLENSLYLRAMIFYDNHIHSQFSPDSRMKLEQAAEKAAEMGLAGISVTDHLDLDAPRASDEFFFDIGMQQRAIEAVAARYPDLKIFKGIEAGLQPCSIEKTRKFLSDYSFDTIIASIHFIDGQDPYYGDYYTGKDYREAYGRALETIYQTAVEFNSILAYLAQEGKALEINTNTYRERNGYAPALDTAVLKRFRELGGEAVSLGSDAHDKERIAENFKVYSEIALKCGFKYIVHFEGRTPFYTPIS